MTRPGRELQARARQLGQNGCVMPSSGASQFTRSTRFQAIRIAPSSCTRRCHAVPANSRCCSLRYSIIRNFERTVAARPSASSIVTWAITRLVRERGSCEYIRGLASRRTRGLRTLAVAHVALPGVEHVADIDLARGVHAAAAAAGIGQVALVTAADLQPFGALARQPHVDAVVDFEVVGENEGTCAIDDV